MKTKRDNKPGYKRLINHYCINCGKYYSKPLKTVSLDNPERKICPSCKNSVRDKKKNLDSP